MTRTDALTYLRTIRRTPAGRLALTRVLGRPTAPPLSQLKNPQPLALAVSEELCRIVYNDLARSLRT